MRIALVGAGHMGRLHAEKVLELRAAGEPLALSGVVDLHPERARALGERLGVSGGGELTPLLRESDAAIVAVPTVAHFAVVREALRAGCDVLVEKPIAASLDQADALLREARERDRVLQVGHLEWYNPAMAVIREHIRRPRFVEAHRMGPYTERSADIDAVRDLMIHDLEILHRILGEEPERVESIGVPVLSETVDIANARVAYPGGCVANLTASRVSPTAMRKLRFFQSDGYFSIDFLNQSAVVFRRRKRGEGEPPEIEMQELAVDPEDALLAQLREFVRNVRRRSSLPPLGDGAVAALRAALRVIQAMPPVDAFE